MFLENNTFVFYEDMESEKQSLYPLQGIVFLITFPLATNCYNEKYEQ